MAVARRGRFTDLLDRYNMHDLLRRLKRNHLLAPSTRTVPNHCLRVRHGRSRMWGRALSRLWA
jgi:hypothetical protein